MSEEYIYHARDAQGWRVPQAGTVSREIYELTVAGRNCQEIAEILGHSLNSVKVLQHKFLYPDRVNSWNRRYKHRQSRLKASREAGRA